MRSRSECWSRGHPDLEASTSLHALQESDNVLIDLCAAWYKVSFEALQRYQRESVIKDESAEQEELAAYKKELEEEINDINAADVGGGRSGVANILRHLYKTYPPKNENNKLDEEALAAALKDDEMKGIKKILVTAIQHYHPDKQDKDKFGMKWSVLCEEITKVLNSHYETFKFPD